VHHGGGGRQWQDGAVADARGVGLDVTSWGFELEIKIKRRRPFRITEGSPGATKRGLLGAEGGLVRID